MSRYDRDIRLTKRVTLNVAAIYLPTYKKSHDMGNFKTAENKLEEHNIGLRVWPQGGAKQPVNSLDIKPYGSNIPHTKAAYRQLRKDVNDWIKNRAPGYPFLMPIIFCEFDHVGVAITPPEARDGTASPAGLISMAAFSMKDQMTALHEMGHSALYPVVDHDLRERGNLMHEAEGRHFLYRYQVEAFGKAFFARY